MPFRTNEFRTKIQFLTSAEMPSMVSEARQRIGVVSNTRYIQEAVCERLSRDLDIPLERLLDALPELRGAKETHFGPNARKPRGEVE